eukprot:6177607-Pleurochrysis_carterae.AAC.1
MAGITYFLNSPLPCSMKSATAAACLLLPLLGCAAVPTQRNPSDKSAEYSASKRSLLFANSPQCRQVSSSQCVLDKPALAAERQEGLACLQEFERITPDFGLLDNPSWSEYAPECQVFDGLRLLAAEPENAASNLDFDAVACDQQADFLHQTSAQLSFGSYAFHASGGHRLTGALDNAALNCVVVNLLLRLLQVSQTSTNVTMSFGQINVAYLSATCPEDFANAVRTCDIAGGGLLQSLDSTIDLFPRNPAITLIGLVVAGSISACNAPADAESALRAFAGSLGQDEVLVNDLVAFRLSGPVKSPESEFCTRSSEVLAIFARAISLQGQYGGDSEDHAQWHSLLADVLILSARAADAF